MSDSSNKLAIENPVKNFCVFQDNQVLTASQLNSIVDYLDRQHRITRVCLHGAGIVCGLEADFPKTKDYITLSKGCALTTDGDMFYYNEQKIFTKFRQFIDDKSKYPPFWSGENNQVPLWELLEEDTKKEDAKDLKEFSSDDNLSDMVVVLYMNSYVADPKDCSDIDCDNDCKQQVHYPRVLLISRDNLEVIIQNHDSIFRDSRDILVLPGISVPRVIMTPTIAPSYHKICQAYLRAILSMQVTFREALSKSNEFIKSILEPEFGKLDLLKKWKPVLDGLFSENHNCSSLEIQYKYDFLKDLVEAYLEFRDETHDFLWACCPDINAFPKHLMLGELAISQKGQKKYRHGFYPSPIISDHDERMAKLIFLYRRIDSIIMSYKVFIANINTVPKRLPIQITPSKDLHHKLGKRALPYYYSNFKSVPVNTFWNYKLALKKRTDEQLGYFAPVYSQLSFIKEPLKYSIDDKDYLRIEGHIGRQYDEVIGEIEEMRKENGLAFDILALKLGKKADASLLNNIRCEMEDVEIEYNLWLNDMECLYSKVINYFSSIEPETIAEKYNSDGSGGGAGSGDSTGSASIHPDVIADVGVTGGATWNTGLMYGAGKGNLFAGGTLNPTSMPYSKLRGNTFEEGVFSGINKNEGSIGEVFANITQYSNASYEYYIYNLLKHFEVLPFYKVIPEYVRQISVDYPALIISKLRAIVNQTPENLTALDFDLYQELYKDLIQTVIEFKELIFKADEDESFEDTGLEKEMIRYLEQLEFACSQNNLRAIIKLYEAKQEQLMQIGLFREYVKKHPGVEHIAGVRKGGTFIVVYYDIDEDESRETERLKGNAGGGFRRLFSPGFPNTVGDDPFSGVVPGLSDSPPMDEVIIGGNPASDPLGKEEVPVIGLPDELIPGLEPGMVVADFAVPYLCCSDCPPVAYIIDKKEEEEEVLLMLPKDTFCHDPDNKEGEPIPFTMVIPENGAVSGPGVFYDSDAGYYFNPHDSSVSVGSVALAVNGITALTVTIVAAPKALFSYTKEEREDESGNPYIVLKIKNLSSNGTDYKWDFGGDSFIRNDLEFEYDIIDQESPILVTLIATNGVCEDLTTQTIDISIDKKYFIDSPKPKYCSNDNHPYEVKIGNDVDGYETPPYKGVLTGPGISPPNEKLNYYYFTPDSAKTGDKKIIYKIDNNTVAEKIFTVVKPFSVGFDIDAVGQVIINRKAYYRFNIHNITPEGKGTFVWFLNDKEIDTNSSNEDFDFDILVSVLKKMEALNFKLVVTREPCTNDHSQPEDNPLFSGGSGEPCIDDCIQRMEDDKALMDELKLIPASLIEAVLTPFSNGLKETINDYQNREMVEKYLAGKMNEVIATRMNGFLSQFSKAWKKAKKGTDQTEQMHLLFQALMRYPLNIIRCQNDDLSQRDALAGTFSKFVEMIKFIKAKKLGFDTCGDMEKYFNELLEQIASKSNASQFVKNLKQNCFPARINFPNRIITGRNITLRNFDFRNPD